ncbi:MAG: hypothetical protein WBW36_17285, partial [Candidatus Sulfotelmatobacter sp.]
HTVNGAPPKAPLTLENGLSLEQYDQKNFGFLRLEVSQSQIVGTYRSAPYPSAGTPSGSLIDSFVIDLKKNTVTTLAAGSAIQASGAGKMGKGSKSAKAPTKKR